MTRVEQKHTCDRCCGEIRANQTYHVTMRMRFPGHADELDEWDLCRSCAYRTGFKCSKSDPDQVNEVEK